VRLYGRAEEGGRVKLPPENVVTGLCLSEWAKRKKAKLAGAQNRAANATMRAIAEANNEGDGEPDSDDESESDDESGGGGHRGGSIDSDGDGAESDGDGDGGGGGDGGGDGDVDGDGDVFSVLREPELRHQLRHLGGNTTVTQADLGAGVARSRAVVEPILRDRLRRLVAGEGEDE